MNKTLVGEGLVTSSVLDQQVRWQQPMMIRHGVDQTRLVLEDAPREAAPFSFLVMGDTDAGDTDAGDTAKESSLFAEAFAQQLLAHATDSQFLLHTGDVTYPTGSYENYLNGFLQPYRSLVDNFPASPDYRNWEIVFNKPLLPVPGNHDYAIGRSQLWQKVMRAVCDRLRKTIGLDLGHYGGQGGEAYAHTFLDDLARLDPEQLRNHLAAHYAAHDKVTADSAVAKAGLHYRAGHFTRLPNRYYSFRCGGVDFFALDSNTWKTSSDVPGFDHAQLDWLVRSLVRSWQTPGTAGRIIYMHHSPYTTEVSRWQQSDTLWVRKHLRSVFARVRQALPDKISRYRDKQYRDKQRLVDLVISGHAHCLEHLQTASNTDFADMGMDWVICGGSGASLRSRWRSESAEILENVPQRGSLYPKVVAKSRMYVGNHVKNNKKQSLYSFIRVEVRPEQACKFQVVPYVVSKGQTGWRSQRLNVLKTHAAEMVGSCYV